MLDAYTIIITIVSVAWLFYLAFSLRKEKSKTSFDIPSTDLANSLRKKDRKS